MIKQNSHVKWFLSSDQVGGIREAYKKSANPWLSLPGALFRILHDLPLHQRWLFPKNSSIAADLQKLSSVVSARYDQVKDAVTAISNGLFADLRTGSARDFWIGGWAQGVGRLRWERDGESRLRWERD